MEKFLWYVAYILIIILYVNLSYLLAIFQWKMYKNYNKHKTSNLVLGFLFWPLAMCSDNVGYLLNDMNEKFYIIWMTFVGNLIKIALNSMLIAIITAICLLIICIVLIIQIIYTITILLIKLLTRPIDKFFGFNNFDKIKPFKFFLDF